MIKDDGTHTCHVLGDVMKHAECVAQIVVPHDTWYSAELYPDAKFSLYSAVVMPGMCLSFLIVQLSRLKSMYSLNCI